MFDFLFDNEDYDLTPLSDDAMAELNKLGTRTSCDDPMSGYRYHWEFANGYGISIIKIPAVSYGVELDQFEIAVLKNGKLCYDTPVTDDVIGWLNEDEVLDYARQIAKLEDPIKKMLEWLEWA